VASAPPSGIAEFGEDDDEREARLEAEANAHARRTRDEVAALGPRPEDPLRASEWLLKILHLGIERMLVAPNISEVDRWKEISTLTGRARDLIPRARLSRAEAVVLGRVEGSAGGPQVEDVKGAAQDQGLDRRDSGPPARRGRPRKRPLR
jgi:hypothetical protein